MSVTIIPTSELNDCGGRCPLFVHMEDGRVVKITGNPDHPDLFPCVKGIHAHETFLSDQRLLYPMKRTGRRGEGSFTRISWKEAIDTISSQWIRIRDSYGVASRYVHYGWGISACMSGLRAARRLLSIDGGFQDYYNSYSTACCSYVTPYLYGTSQSGSTYDTLLSSELIILWAHNPAETRFDNLMYYLRQCKKKGIPMIVIDPRKNATARMFGCEQRSSDSPNAAVPDYEWIPLLPGTDAALMDAMAYVIYTENLYDHDFVNSCCQGFTRESMPVDADPADCYFDYLLGTKDGIKKDPDWGSHITGVPAHVIISLARRFAGAKPAALLQGYGGQRHLNGEQFTRGGIMLACLTGNVGIRGGWASGAGYCKLITEPVLPSVPNPVKELIPVYEWTTSLAEGKLKMILNLAGNALINQHGDINHTKALLEDESKCEFIVCSDIFMTASAKYADILLPGVSMFEADNLTSAWGQGDYITCVTKVMEPLGESREDYDWLCEVAQKLGHYEAFTQGHPTTSSWLKDIYNDIRGDYPSLLPYDEMRRAGIARLDRKESVIAFADHSFPTPSGKVEIYSPRLAAIGSAYSATAPSSADSHAFTTIPSQSAAADDTGFASSQSAAADDADSASSQSATYERIPPIPRYVPSPEGPGQSSRFPLSLIGWQSITRTHSVHDNNPSLQRRAPQMLWMNPQDASGRGIHDQDTVIVYNKRGTLKVPVHVTEDIQPGCVALAAGAWYQPDENGIDTRGSINVLTTLASTPLAHGNGQHTNLVEVQRDQD